MRLFVSRLSRSQRTIMGNWARDRSKYMPHEGLKQRMKALLRSNTLGKVSKNTGFN